MSVAATAWAWAQTCPSGVAKSVLAYLANCANQDGEDCYPSIATICDRTQHHELAVRKAIRQLSEFGLLEVTPFILPNGRQGSNRYRLPIPTPAKSQEAGELATPVEPQESSEIATPAISQVSAEPHKYQKTLEEQGFLALGPVSVTPANSQEKRYSKEGKKESSLRSDAHGSEIPCPPLPTGDKADKRGTRLPPNWTPSDEMRAFAVDRGVDPDAALEDFVTYWPSRSGREAFKLDWNLTFKNSVIKLGRMGMCKLSDRKPAPGASRQEEHQRLIRGRGL